MPEELPALGFVIYLLAVSYAFGQLWYSIFEYRHDVWMRTLSFPLLGIIAGEALWATNFAAGPVFFGIHIYTAFVGSLVASLVDLGIHSLRPTHERMVPEVRGVRA